MTEHHEIQTHEACCTPAERDAAEPRRTWTYTPSVDIHELEDEYVIEADVPGTAREHIDLNVEDGLLTIQAHAPARGEGRGRLVRQEYGVGDFHRRFRLDRTIDPSKIDATYEQGVLTVRLPKADEAKAHRIEIK